MPNFFTKLSKSQMEVFLRKFDNAFLETSFIDGFVDQNYNGLISERKQILNSIKQNFKIQNIRLLKNANEYLISIEDLRNNHKNTVRESVK